MVSHQTLRIFVQNREWRNCCGAMRMPGRATLLTECLCARRSRGRGLRAWEAADGAEERLGDILDLEEVAGAGDGVDETGLARGGLDLLAQPVDELFD